MSDEGLSRQDKRAMLCAFAALVSLALMGAVSEFLSNADLIYKESENRAGGMIAMTLFTFVLATAAMVLAILDVSASIQGIVILVAFLASTAAVAISLSPKTVGDSWTAAVALLAWIPELSLLAALFYLRESFSGGGGKGGGKASTSTPAYNPTPVSMGAPYAAPGTAAPSMPPPPPPPPEKAV